MQQVPNQECNTVSAQEEPRWNRVPRVQLLRNENDQRVPQYFDQTVPVFHAPLRTTPADAGGNRRELVRHYSHGEQKGARKWDDINVTEWFRSVREIFRAAGAESHAFSVSEILQSFSISSSKWSGIEQDLFTCTAFLSKDLLVPTAADFSVNKKSKTIRKSFL